MEFLGRRRAAALRYTREQEGSPTLVAKGEDELAEQIVAVAREHGIPIHQDPALVGVLSRLNLDDQIPAQLFVAVAAVLGFIYRLESEQESPGSTPEPDASGPKNTP
jgi:flagellar biosynthesis protein